MLKAGPPVLPTLQQQQQQYCRQLQQVHGNNKFAYMQAVASSAAANLSCRWAAAHA
jgi:hypothetical protein